MSSAIAGTVVSTVELSTIDAQWFCNCVPAISPDGQYVYMGRTNFGGAGGICRVPLANFVNAEIGDLYENGFFGGNVSAVFLSPDGATLYAVVAGVGICSAFADGSSGSPTTIWESFSPNGVPSFLYDPDFEQWYYGDNSNRGVLTIDVGGNSVAYEFKTQEYTGRQGLCRYADNRLVVGSNNNSPGYITEYDRETGHRKSLAGNGTAGSATTAGNAFSVPLHDATFISSDEDGRIYFVSSGKLWLLASGTITQIATCTYALHAYGANRIVAGGGYTWQKLS